jgi:hypothetical protein
MRNDFTMRQSTLTTFARCPLSARFELEAGERHSPELSRGTLAHSVVEECLRTMHRHGNSQIPVAEALEIMYEVLAQRGVASEDVLALPPEEKLHLKQFVVRFASDWEWDVRRIVAIEERLWHPITCEDGKVRTLTGTPDLILVDPPDGLVVCDLKSGFGPPKTPRSDDPAEPRRYLTARGMAQLDAYGLLAMQRFPRAQRVTLREIHPMTTESRDATLDRDDLAEVERLIGIDLMLMDRAVSEGVDSPIWKPVPGKQCAWCIAKRQCPLPSYQRGAGAIEDAAMALRYALDFEAVTPQRTELLEALKMWVDAHGPIPLPDGRVLGWHRPRENGSRRFEAHVPEPDMECVPGRAGL